MPPKPKLVMRPDHPRWQEFQHRLQSEEGCHFRHDPERGVVWKCDGSHERPYATAILKAMKHIDIPASLRWMEQHGGHCDCEIVFNCE